MHNNYERMLVLHCADKDTGAQRAWVQGQYCTGISNLLFIPSPYTTTTARQGRGSRNWVGLCWKKLFIQWKKREKGTACASIQGYEWVWSVLEKPKNVFGCLCGTRNKYIWMSELIILDLFMQNICNDGEMLSHVLTHSMHFNCPSKINKNKLNDAFFMVSKPLANPNGLPVFPNMKLTELWRNDLKKGDLYK